MFKLCREINSSLDYILSIITKFIHRVSSNFSAFVSSIRFHFVKAEPFEVYSKND